MSATLRCPGWNESCLGVEAPLGYRGIEWAFDTGRTRRERAYIMHPSASRSANAYLLYAISPRSLDSRLYACSTDSFAVALTLSHLGALLLNGRADPLIPLPGLCRRPIFEVFLEVGAERVRQTFEFCDKSRISRDFAQFYL